jgi:hypothetical protein
VQGQAMGAGATEVGTIRLGDVPTLAADETLVDMPYHGPEVLVQHTVWASDEFVHGYLLLGLPCS